MKKTLTYLISTLIFNTAIAGVLSMLMPSIPFWHEFIYSQCIGLSVMTINVTVIAFVRKGIMQWVALSLTLPVSVALGLTFAFAFTGVGSWHDEHVWQPMVIGLFFGLIGAITFLLSDRIEAEVRHRQLIQSESEKRALEAHLKLLQAQIEPHFLFNTLANVSSLIETDPQNARQLLEHLNDWLRVALARARSEQALLDDELSLLENYLQILTIRFGSRLSWYIDAPIEVRRLPFPPMLLQPLVENAIRHGIEPKIGGGTLRIIALLEKAKIVLEVFDDGVGLPELLQHGAGLENVQSRLATLYGDSGSLTLSENELGGTTARLEIPR